MGNFQKQIKQLRDEGESLAKKLQLLGVSVLWHAKWSGNLFWLERLIQAFPETFDKKRYIGWLQNHGKVAWSNKKKRFVYRSTGKWRLCAAAATSWSGDPAHAFSISSRYDKVSEQSIVSEVEEDPAEDTIELSTHEQIKAYLAAHPAPDPIGRFGVPQAKFRYGTYGQSTMELDFWRLHVKRKR